MTTWPYIDDDLNDLYHRFQIAVSAEESRLNVPGTAWGITRADFADLLYQETCGLALPPAFQKLLVVANASDDLFDRLLPVDRLGVHEYLELLEWAQTTGRRRIGDYPAAIAGTVSAGAPAGRTSEVGPVLVAAGREGESASEETAPEGTRPEVSGSVGGAGRWAAINRYAFAAAVVVVVIGIAAMYQRWPLQPEVVRINVPVPNPVDANLIRDLDAARRDVSTKTVALREARSEAQRQRAANEILKWERRRIAKNMESLQAKLDAARTPPTGLGIPTPVIRKGLRGPLTAGGTADVRPSFGMLLDNRPTFRWEHKTIVESRIQIIPREGKAFEEPVPAGVTSYRIRRKLAEGEFYTWVLDAPGTANAERRVPFGVVAPKDAASVRAQLATTGADLSRAAVLERFYLYDQMIDELPELEPYVNRLKAAFGN